MPLEQVHWPPSLISERTGKAKKVSRVYRGTPADEIGIQDGWLLMTIDGKPVPDTFLEDCYSAPPKQIVFFDPQEQICIQLLDHGMPLGMELRQTFNKDLVKTTREGLFHRNELFEPWMDDAKDTYKSLKRHIETALLPWYLLPLYFIPLPDSWIEALIPTNLKRKMMLKNKAREGKVAYALALLEDGERDWAEKFAESYFIEDAADNSSGSLTSIIGAAFYVRAVTAFSRGEEEYGKEQVLNGLYYCDKATPLLDLYFKKFGGFYLPVLDKYIGHRFPLADYMFEAKDPFDLCESTEKTLELPKKIDALKDDEFGFVCMLGSYRSNGPFLEDLHLLKGFQDNPETRPKFAIAITALDDVNWHAANKYRYQQEKKHRENGLDLEIGYDLDGEICGMLDFSKSPTWFMIGNGGIVLASGDLYGESFLVRLFNKENG